VGQCEPRVHVTRYSFRSPVFGLLIRTQTYKLQALPPVLLLLIVSRSVTRLDNQHSLPSTTHTRCPSCQAELSSPRRAMSTRVSNILYWCICALADTSTVEAPVTWKAYLICAFASFGGIFFGYDSGYINGTNSPESAFCCEQLLIHLRRCHWITCLHPDHRRRWCQFTYWSSSIAHRLYLVCWYILRCSDRRRCRRGHRSSYHYHHWLVCLREEVV